VLFTDLVDSTATAARVGDVRWNLLLDRHDELCRLAVERYRGRLVKITGDGIVATFDGPAARSTAPKTVRANLEGLDLRLRAGIHTGEIELRGGDISASQ
jgi:class 3 adenylate cyclase